MKKASEYRQHAQECRVLAGQMDSEEQRSQLLQMAEHWEKLAADREALLGLHPELVQAGEQEEDEAAPAAKSRTSAAALAERL